MQCVLLSYWLALRPYSFVDRPVMMQPCGKSDSQKIVITEVDTAASEKAANSKYEKEGAIGHRNG